VGSESKPIGHEWTELDWASDGVDSAKWNHPANAYTKSKVDTEHMLNQAADASRGKWDVVTLNPAMICGPILFKSQNGQWIEQLGRLAGGLEPNWPQGPMDMYYNIIDVRDLVKAHRLAAESTVDHKATKGGARYILHGCGGRSAMRLGTDVKYEIARSFPTFSLGEVKSTTKSGKRIQIEMTSVNDSRKVKEILGVTLRPVEETIRDCVETSITLGLIEPTLKTPVSKL